jgi:hypothetical protein
MTKFIFKNYIPKEDIKVRPTALVNEIYKLLDIEIEDNSYEDIISINNLKIIKNLYKKIKILLVNYHFWNNIASYDFCCYQYKYTKENKDEDIGKICGRRIDTKHHKEDRQKYLCAEHNRNHRKNNAKSINVNNDKRCYIICNNNKRCKYTYESNGICRKHIKKGKNNNNIYICKLDINRIKIIEKSNKNYVRLFYNKEIKINPLKDKSLKNTDVKKPIILTPVLDNKSLIFEICLENKENQKLPHKGNYRLKPINNYIENLKKNIINIISELDDEYQLIYLYNFINNNKKSPGLINKRTITS